MLITKDNLKDLKIGQQVYIAHWGFKMIKKPIYLGVHNILPNSKVVVNKHVFYEGSDSFDITLNLDGCKEWNLPKQIRGNIMWTNYEEACERSRELALECIDHYNTHDFKNNPIIVM